MDVCRLEQVESEVQRLYGAVGDLPAEVLLLWASFLTDAKQYTQARELLETHVLVGPKGAPPIHETPTCPGIPSHTPIRPKHPANRLKWT